MGYAAVGNSKDDAKKKWPATGVTGHEVGGSVLGLVERPCGVPHKESI
jgi:hypothetical protein